MLGFSDDPNRLNVLLTRAKRGLIVLGHQKTLETCDLWDEWISSAAQKVENLPKLIDDLKKEEEEENSPKSGDKKKFNKRWKGRKRQ